MTGNQFKSNINNKKNKLRFLFKIKINNSVNYVKNTKL